MDLRERANETVALAGQKRALRGDQGGGTDVGWIRIAERSLSVEWVHAGTGPRSSLIPLYSPLGSTSKMPEAIPHIGRNFSSVYSS